MGQKWGKLVAIKFLGIKNYNSHWLFRCECGKEKALKSSNVIGGYTKSCGCLYDKIKHKHKHNMCFTRFYGIWNLMKSRCQNPKVRCYKNYGGRGIKVCLRWNNFTNFRDDMYESYLEHKKNNKKIKQVYLGGRY